MQMNTVVQVLKEPGKAAQSKRLHVGCTERAGEAKTSDNTLIMTTSRTEKHIHPEEFLKEFKWDI
ncbi:hypothetical protein [Acetivibrio clariflavus]|uniref:hypothetical protein n=1 Tax=Acetivibrio clariflavus TaxID=288965 RepID=UPI0004807926|nr:hypothetical protein [Acetivibrio clariflavus]